MSHEIKISANEVHLWCVYDEDISEQDTISRYHELLNENEKKQQRQFHFARNRHQYLVTRALVRSVISQYVSEIHPKELIFGNSYHGKPYIKTPPLPFPLEFNISHTEKMVVLAVTNGSKVGVDIEYVRRTTDTTSIANRFFSESEIRNLESIDKMHRNDRFFELWTLKEAYIKARGLGLSIPLDKFRFDLTGKGHINIAFDEDHIVDTENDWRFWLIKPNETHKIALAITDKEINERPYFLKIMTTIPLLNTHPADYPVVRCSNFKLSQNQAGKSAQYIA